MIDTRSEYRVQPSYTPMSVPLEVEQARSHTIDSRRAATEDAWCESVIGYERR